MDKRDARPAEKALGRIRFESLSDAELDAIVAIGHRAMAMAERAQLQTEPHEFFMALITCHLGGCRLKLAQLAEAPGFDFAHDVFGILRHIDRDTGVLGDCFLPRYAVLNDE